VPSREAGVHDPRSLSFDTKLSAEHQQSTMAAHGYGLRTSNVADLGAAAYMVSKPSDRSRE